VDKLSRSHRRRNGRLASAAVGSLAIIALASAPAFASGRHFSPVTNPSHRAILTAELVGADPDELTELEDMLGAGDDQADAVDESADPSSDTSGDQAGSGDSQGQDEAEDGDSQGQDEADDSGSGSQDEGDSSGDSGSGGDSGSDGSGGGSDGGSGD
jgi:uncharacterized membrane protein YgcG